MNIGITCYPTFGGSGIVASELGQKLAQRGHTVHFISSAMPGRLLGLEDRVFFHEVEAMNYPLFEYVPYALALATKMVEVTELQGLDLLHVHYAIPHSISGILARDMLHPKRLPLITTLHGTDITLVGRDQSYRTITRYGIQKSDGVTAVSEFLRRATFEEFCGDCDIRVIPNFIDVERVRRFYSDEMRSRFSPAGEKLLVHVSNFRPVKRVEDVVRVFHRVSEEIPARLLMIGDGPERSRAQHLVKELGLARHVFFLGMVGLVENYLSVCDLMLLTSETESFGLSALEAMACEVPVVATRVGGIPELVVDGECGLLSPLGDIAAMADGALTILEEDRLEDFRKCARSRAVEQYSADRIVPVYEDYYREVREEL